MESRPQGPARQNHMVGTADSTAPAPSFHQLLAQQLHPVWEYKLARRNAARVMFPTGATRDEALRHLELKFPGVVVQYLKPVYGGDE